MTDFFTNILPTWMDTTVLSIILSVIAVLFFIGLLIVIIKCRQRALSRQENDS
jgi:uncharacterized membrane protein YqiK